MKGISPMISIVLLIAFTVAVGGLISLFLTGLTTTQTGVTETMTESQMKCAGVYISIDRVTNSTIFYSNPSPQAITSIVFTTSDGTSFPGASSLPSGTFNTTNWTRTASEPGNTSLTVTGKCLNSVIVRGKCTSEMACWD